MRKKISEEVGKRFPEYLYLSMKCDFKSNYLDIQHRDMPANEIKLYIIYPIQTYLLSHVNSRFSRKEENIQNII